MLLGGACTSEFLESCTGCTALLLLRETVGTPTFSLTSGTYPANQNISITTSTASANILYTTDGSIPAYDSSGNPEGTSMLFAGALSINSTVTLKAMAYYSDFRDSVIGTATYTFCPVGYILVPANPSVGTTQAFCMAKYEMKNVAGVALSQASGGPWTNNEQNIARGLCSSLGTGYHLMTNPEWMSAARNIEGVVSNWSGGAVGSGALNQGHSDDGPNSALGASTDTNPCSGTGQTCSDVVWHAQRRTHTLSNGEVVWDMAGNVYDFIDWNVPTDKTNPTTGSWLEMNVQVPTTAMPASSFKSLDTSYTSAQGIGQIYSDLNTVGGVAARGGHWNNGIATGVYLLALSWVPTQNIPYAGFRCAYIL